MSNVMMLGPNFPFIDKYVENTLLPQSLIYYDCFDTSAFGSTPSNNTPISVFKDKYRRGTWDLSQPTGTSQPLYQSNNGKPYLLFDGIDDVLYSQVLNSATYFSNNEATVILSTFNASSTIAGSVLKYVGGNVALRILGIAYASPITRLSWVSGATQNSSTDFSTMKMVAGVRSTVSNSKNIFSNGTIEGVAQSPGVFTHATESLFFGAFRNAPNYSGFNGAIGEMVIFNKALNNYQINLICRYFMKRRGI